MLPRLVGARALAARPGLSLVLGIVFLAGALLFATGRFPGATHDVTTRGETTVMTISCLIVAVYFLRAAWRARREAQRQ